LGTNNNNNSFHLYLLWVESQNIHQTKNVSDRKKHRKYSNLSRAVQKTR
jgi:hypothetical protein